jgi:hypothetical protein
MVTGHGVAGVIRYVYYHARRRAFPACKPCFVRLLDRYHEDVSSFSLRPRLPVLWGGYATVRHSQSYLLNMEEYEASCVCITVPTLEDQEGLHALCCKVQRGMA